MLLVPINSVLAQNPPDELFEKVEVLREALDHRAENRLRQLEQNPALQRFRLLRINHRAIGRGLITVLAEPGNDRPGRELRKKSIQRVRGGSVIQFESRKPRRNEISFVDESVKGRLDPLIESVGWDNVFLSNHSALVLSDIDGELDGYYYDAGKEYLLRTVDGDIVAVAEVDRPENLTGDDVLTDPHASVATVQEGKPESFKAVYSNSSVIRVLVAYTGPAVAFVGNVYSNAHTLISGVNTALSNSRANPRLVLVSVLSLDFSEPSVLPGCHIGTRYNNSDYTSPVQDFRHDACVIHQQGNGVADAIHYERLKKKADLVLVVGARDNVNDNKTGFVVETGSPPKNAFAIINIRKDPTYHTAAHEIGHIIGAGHGEGQGDNAIAEYARGFSECYSRRGGIQTMQVQNVVNCGGNDAEKIPLYSTPGVVYLGVGPCGSDAPKASNKGAGEPCILGGAQVGEANKTDVTRLWNERLAEYTFVYGNRNWVLPEITSYRNRITCPTEIPECNEPPEASRTAYIDKNITGFSNEPLRQINIFPNPSEGPFTIEIPVKLEDDSDALTVGVFDSIGRRVVSRVVSATSPVTRFIWDGRTDSGEPLANGLYHVVSLSKQLRFRTTLSLLR